MVVGLDTLRQIGLDPEHGAVHVRTGHLLLLLQQMVSVRRGRQKGSRRHGFAAHEGSGQMIHAGRGGRRPAAHVQLRELHWIHFSGYFGREGDVQLAPIS